MRRRRHKGGGDDGGDPSGGDDSGNPPWMVAVGTFLGWVSSVLYLASRVSQIYKNYSRRSAEGLALAMFAMAAAANMCTGAGILLRTFTLQELADQGPWLAGSLGTITLDMVILAQSLKYGNKAQHHAGGAPGGGGAGGDAQQQQQHADAHHSVHVHPHHHVGHHHPHRGGAARGAARQERGGGGGTDDSDERAPLLPT